MRHKHIAAIVSGVLVGATLAFAVEHRSYRARHEFEVQSGYPHGRPGYVVDHIIPLACGGPDEPSNMQWQTDYEAKAKDKWERKECRIIDGQEEGCCK